MLTKEKPFRPGLVAAVLAFLGSWSFFLFAYPYHLMRREQQNLFLFDGFHIRETYRGMGFLGRFVADFLEQFFLAPEKPQAACHFLYPCARHGHRRRDP